MKRISWLFIIFFQRQCGFKARPIHEWLMTSSLAFITLKQMQAGVGGGSLKICYRFWGNGCGGAGNLRLKWHGRTRLPATPSGSGNTSRSLPHQYISSGALSSNGEISRMGRNNRIFIPLIHIQFFSPPPIASLSSAHAYELGLYLSFKWVVLAFTISFL